MVLAGLVRLIEIDGTKNGRAVRPLSLRKDSSLNYIPRSANQVRIFDTPRTEE
jgi:hypothetical protein